MTTLVLARHGNTFEAGEVPRYVGCRSDLPLTQVGRAQAQRLGSALKSRNLIPSRVFSGPLLRQYDTARIALAAMDLPDVEVERLDALSEIDLGKWEGLTKPEIEQKWAKELSDWEEKFTWPTAIFGSSKEELTADLSAFLRGAAHSAAQSDSEVILVVTSNGIMRLIYALYRFSDSLALEVNWPKQAKVATGAYCILDLLHDELSNLKVQIAEWNVKPEVS